MAGIRGIYNWDFLAFPGRAPGFDPTHPAALGTVVSAVSAGANFVNFLNGKQGTVSGSLTSAINGNIGPTTVYAAGGTNRAAFTQASPTSPASFTCAAVFYQTGYAPSGYATFIWDTTNNGLLTQFSTHALDIIVNNAQQIFTNLVPSLNTPYFAVASGSSTKANGLLLNLATGQILSQTISYSIALGSAATSISIGNTTGGSIEIVGGIGAAMMGYNNFLSPAALLQWAQRPWDFWYPSAAQTILFSGLRRKSTQTQVYGTIVG